MVLVLAAMLGLAVGSFLNVVVHRVPRNESLLRPRSHCPACAEPVRHRHNVPVVGWLVLGGRCADCRTRISVRYPLVELATAALFVAITARFGVTWALPAYLYLAAIAVPLALIDLDLKRLPDRIVLPSYVIGAVLLLAAAVGTGDPRSAVRAVIAMSVLWCAYYVLAFTGGMGFGDVKLAGLLGLYLGWLGWSSVWVGTFTGFLLGGTVGVALLLTRRATGKTAIPFGPSMLAGGLLAVFAAAPVADWYTSILYPAG
ncbi:prepilin peptidase [Cryptosporangium sp. NPDC048952]|uniref:prepilin peptidase n=1 Tax=Cryptosporangium sp. NPDC048952 TaxID=3363961 RepID=UPI00371EC85C